MSATIQLKAETRKKPRRSLGLTHAQHKWLAKRERLLERVEAASQTYGDVLAVIDALTVWVEEAAHKAVRAQEAVDKAREALDAHRTEMMAVTKREASKEAARGKCRQR